MTEVNGTVKKAPRKPRPSEIAKKAAKAAAKAKPVKKTRGRPLMYPDKTIVRMPVGWLKRVNAALKTDESQGEFMRVGIEKELKVRKK